MRARAEIAHILRGVLNQSAMLSAYFGEEKNAFALTSLLAVLPDDDELLFDVPAQRDLVEQLVAAGPIVCVTNLEGIKIKFELDELTETEYEGYAALAARLPEAVVRLQRREYFRVVCPRSNSPRCTITHAVEGREQRAEFDVADLSLGGLALTYRQSPLSLEPGNEYKNCIVNLPGEGSFTTALTVRNVYKLAGGTSPVPVTRAGCSFVQPAPEGVAMLQRYTMRLERERNARFGKT